MTENSTSEKTHAHGPNAAEDTEQPTSNKPKAPWLQRTFFPISDIRQTAGMAKSMFDALTGDERKARNETFAESVRRQNLSAADLKAAYLRQRVIFMILFFMFVLAMVYIARMLLVAAQPSDIVIAILALGPVSVLIASALRASFRAWQIRTKQLGGFNRFIIAYGEWWPRSLKSYSLDASEEAAARKKLKKNAANPQLKPSSGR